MPAIAALGGMIVPALIYTAINAGGDAADGWGIPMATDIAMAVGVLSLLSQACHPRSSCSCWPSPSWTTSGPSS